MDQAKLDDYLRVGKKLFDGEITFATNIPGKRATIDDREDYKEKIVLRLYEARDAVLAGKEDWPALVKRGLDCNLSEWRTRQAITQWVDDQPNDAMAALREFWGEGDTLPEERIRAFVAEVPPHANWGGAWAARTRLREVSVLLMALTEGYPPFKSRQFSRVYKYMKHDPLSSQDEGEIYKHAIEFLDRLLERKEALGFERPRDHLDAQSLVWTMHGFLENGMIKLPPPNGTNNPDPLTEILDDLSDELLLEPTSFLSETVWPLLEDKKQIIFQGPPGTGKTHVARELAKCLAGSEDRVRVVQFHPSYAYEDFVQGFRPKQKGDGVGFELRHGPLRQMEKQARDEPDERHFLVIDEINRGNLGKILGELYYLLEYRNEPMPLLYSDETFAMPPNLYIIGTMNTADRSIALVDLALRRRFHFVEFHPDKEPIKGLLGRWIGDEAPDMKCIADLVDAANKKLGEQRREAAIGPTYFMRPGLDETRARRIWEHNVLPYVEEQLYGDPGTLNAIEALWPDSEASNAGDGEQDGGSGETTTGGGDSG